MQYRFQNADFDADFESAEKLQKNHAKNYQRKSDRKFTIFTFIFVCKSFHHVTFLGDF
jgi:hypothetical protein